MSIELDILGRTARRFVPCWLMVMGLLLSGVAWAQDTVWLALTDRGGVYAMTAGAMASELSRDAPRLTVVTGSWQELSTASARTPNLIVTFGASALRGVLERQRQEPALAGVLILAALIPQATYDSLVLRPTVASAVLLDQPVERYLDLIRVALPAARRIGVLFGPDSVSLRPALQRAAAARGLQLQAPPALGAGDDIYPPLNAVLSDADVFLALPDNRIFASGSQQNVLVTSYRRRIPVVTYSEPYVRSGAAMGLFATPAQVAAQAAAAVRVFLITRSLPAPRAASGYSIAINSEVARSLGLNLGDPEQLLQALRRKEDGR